MPSTAANRRPKVFISYGNDEIGRKFADEIKQRLKQLGIHTALDIDHLSSNDKLREYIERLSSGILFLTLISRGLLTSKYVLEELRYSLLRKDPMLPILIEDIPYESLPSELSSYQGLDMPRLHPDHTHRADPLICPD